MLLYNLNILYEYILCINIMCLCSYMLTQIYILMSGIIWINLLAVFNFNIYLFTAVLGLSCGAWVSCPIACGILASLLGIEHVSPALEDGFLITGPPLKSQHLILNNCLQKMMSWKDTFFTSCITYCFSLVCLKTIHYFDDDDIKQCPFWKHK